MLDLEGPP
jgi:hypothetical protein